MFVDASGDPGRFVGTNTRYYVLSGLIIKPEKWYHAHNKVIGIFEKFFPRIDLSKLPELHANHLRRGKGIYGKLDKSKRKEFGNEVYNLIKELDPVLISIVVNKEKHYQKYPKPHPVKYVSFQYLMDRYERFLRRRGSYGILVCDLEGKRDRDIKAILDNSRIFGTYDHRREEYWQYKKIVETIFFIDSKTSIGLQLADFVAYATFQYYEKRYCERFEELKPYFDKSPNGSIEGYGLKVVP